MQNRHINNFVFIGFGLSGMAALIYEVAWTRSLSTIMGSSTYALSTMLAAFMGGLSVGGFLGGRISARVKRPELMFAFCELGIGLAGLLTMPVIKSLVPVYMAAYYTFHLSFNAFSLVQFLIVFMIMGIPTTLMGATFPLVMALYAREEGRVGEKAGHLYCINTFGAIVGSVLAGFYLIPSVGVTWTSISAAALNICTAMTILFLLRENGKLVLAGTVTGSIVLGALLISGPSVPFFSFYSAHRFASYDFAKRIYDFVTESNGTRVLFHRDGIEGEVYLTETSAGGQPTRALINGGKLEGGDSEDFALLAFLPYFAHAVSDPPEKALSIGLGSGNTLAELSRFPIDRIDSVELNDGIIEANRLFLQPDLFRDARINHIRADGRHFLELTRERYDIIVVSPSWAVEMASAAMLTDEFFSLAASRLHESGVLAVWVDYFIESDEDMAMILRTFSRNFSHATAWQDTSGSIILVGANTPRYPSEAAVIAELNSFRPDLATRYRVAVSDQAMEGIAAGPINTDDRPIIEFHNARNIIIGPAETHRKHPPREHGAATPDPGGRRRHPA